MTTPFDTPEWAAFVAAVRADPANDLPRLVAADWLDDRREADRAELIRLMVATRTQLKPKRRWHQMTARCRRLLGRPGGGREDRHPRPAAGSRRGNGFRPADGGRRRAG